MAAYFFGQGCKLEVESIVREVCDRIIYDAQVSKETVLKRVAAIEILGSVYSSVKKEEIEHDYVKIENTRK
jgi:hypothetical protein